MKQEILNLIDKVVGKKGIMRAPAWFVNKLFKKTLDYADEIGYLAMKYTDSKLSETEPYIIYAKNAADNKELSYSQKEENKKFFDAVVAGKASECVWYDSEAKTWLTSASVTFRPPDASNDNPTVDVSFVYGGKIVLFKPTNVTYRACTLGPNGQCVTYGLDAISKTNVIDNLESESTTAALSANQGRVLAERIGDIDTILNGINGEEI